MTVTSSWNILIRPIITESSTAGAEMAEPQYVFEVMRSANKIQIARAVEEAFSVRVKNVNTLVQRGKPKSLRRGRLPGRRPDYKKAFITLEGADNHRFLYRDAIDIINQNMADLKRKQVREMLIYKTNQSLKPPTGKK